MEKQLNNYLEQIEKYLKPLPVSERVDIVQEIKSEMQELQAAGQTPEQILARLGNPKELARAYLGDMIAQSSGFSWSRLAALCAFYSVTGFSGLVVIPTLVICAPVFLLCGIITPLLGALKAVDVALGLHIPYVQYIGIAGIQNPALVFVLCLAMGLALCALGYGCWKLLVGYIQSVSRIKRMLET
ncbi:MAG TPA: DUF1700 domain-containing protein [Candidatus Gemmiger excrementavium]|uniref:DUF1700 domain-containing protein n=1 Tax=Candidatus Gemmiger excrementavium TaxID=2838608 RepID=A0A9D2JGL1_9FIRM|nr:DUF1700 domain-containing protein [Candidatus Gemmiger excrementavium]